MEIPGLGPVSLDAELGWYRSAPLRVPVLNSTCHFVLNGYDDDPAKEEIHAAIGAFRALDEATLRAAGPWVFAYYSDIMADVEADDEWYVEISGPDGVWEHVHVGDEVMVGRDTHGDRRVYLSVECECDWEPEHGLQIVFRDGREVTKVGPYDGALTNAAAYARDDLAGVVYHRLT